MINAVCVALFLAGAGCASDSHDASAPTGAQSKDGGGPSNADKELAAALNPNGVRTDRRRAELVSAAFCPPYMRCSVLMNDGGGPKTLEECVSESLKEWDRAAAPGGDSQACLDAQLDFASCVAGGGSCDEIDERCPPFLDRVESLCI